MARVHGWPVRVLVLCGGLGLLYAVPAGGIWISAERTLAWSLGAVLPCYAAGLFLWWRAPAHPVARRLVAAGSWAALGLVVRFTLTLFVEPSAWNPPTPLVWTGLLVVRTIDVVVGLLLVRLVALLPDGRHRYVHERVLLSALWLLTLYPLALMASDVPEQLLPRLLVQPEAWLPAVGAGLLLVRSLLRARDRGARSSRLTLVAVVAFAVLLGRGSSRLFRMWQGETGVAYFIGAALGALPYLLISVGMVYAGFRHLLPGMDITLRKPAVYGLLWLITGGWYLGMTTALGLTAGQYLPIGLAVLVAVIATMLFQPVRGRLNQLAARRVFGARPSNFELLVQCGTTLEHAYDVKRLAPQLATSLREGLNLRWVRVELGATDTGDGPFAVATAGSRASDDIGAQVGVQAGVQLRHGEEALGFIEYGPKDEGRFTPEDRDLVETLARQAALAVHNARLTAELSARVDEVQRQASELNASRTRIVQAQDTERRRIERQLHDGIQQELVALVAKLRLARNQLRGRGGAVDSTLTEIQEDAVRVIEELREFAHGIHPPVLTDQGLAAAVTSRARRLPIPVTVHVEPTVCARRFAPEIEESAFFLVSEALTNVLKHADAARVAIRISHDEEALLLAISDDGVGFPTGSRLGSGLTGMRDRIEAVGGELSIESRPGGGTTVHARLTVRRRETTHA
ncbi:ATP-binding protein [Streptomyces sp. P1-3]|uniref:GAF domain-containing sensor histidine kinase n=1 Tax=Streptomyces sp. P1-3 TaxID=3421658 RepID=UPI003D36FC8B